MNRRQLAKNAFLGLCGALLGKKVESPVEPPSVSLSHSVGGDKWMCTTVIQYPEHPAGSTESGWDFLNEPGEDVYNG